MLQGSICAGGVAGFGAQAVAAAQLASPVVLLAASTISFLSKGASSAADFLPPNATPIDIKQIDDNITSYGHCHTLIIRLS